MLKKLLILAACGIFLIMPNIASAEKPARGSVAEGTILGPPPDTLIFAAPLSGPLESMGKSAKNGAELAFKIWGGGYKMEVIDEAGPERKDIDLAKAAVIVGYFTESRFMDDAPRYIYLKKPVLLPFLTTNEAASRGPSCFFRLMPTAEEQGQFMAMTVLTSKKRPTRILVISGESDYQKSFATALTETLSNPIKAQPPIALQSAGKKPQKLPPPIKPLDPKATVLTVSLAQAMDPEGIAELAKVKPNLIILGLSISESLSIAPVLNETRFAKVETWGGMGMAFKESAAAFVALNINLKLSLPIGNPLNSRNKAALEFIKQYEDVYKSHPSWISALAYDSMTLAIKAAGSGTTTAEHLAFLAGQSHHNLGNYKVLPGGGGQLPMAFMPVTQESLGFLP